MVLVEDDTEQVRSWRRLRATALHDLSNRMDRLLVSMDDVTEPRLGGRDRPAQRRSAVRATLDEIDLAVVVHDRGRPDQRSSTSAPIGCSAPTPPIWSATPRCRHGGIRAVPTARPLPAEDHPAQRVLSDGATEAEAVIGLRIGGERGSRDVALVRGPGPRPDR